MGMRETTGSMRAYFVVAGALSAISGLAGLGRAVPEISLSQRLELLVTSAGHLALGVAFIVAGVVLPQALVTGAGWIKRLLVITGCFSVAQLLVGAGEYAAAGSAAGAAPEIALAAMSGLVFGAVVGIAIAAYLYVNLVRLSAAARVAEPLPPMNKL